MAGHVQSVPRRRAVVARHADAPSLHQDAHAARRPAAAPGRQAVGNDDLAELPPRPPIPDDPVERFRQFVNDETPGSRPCLFSVLHHLDTGRQRRRDGNVALFHYADYKTETVTAFHRAAPRSL